MLRLSDGLEGVIGVVDFQLREIGAVALGWAGGCDIDDIPVPNLDAGLMGAVDRVLDRTHGKLSRTGHEDHSWLARFLSRGRDHGSLRDNLCCGQV